MATPSRSRRRVFFLLALSIPLLAFGALEGSLRLVHYRGDLSLFRRLGFLGGRYEGLNKRFAARYFADVRLLPTPTNDLLLVSKPANDFRVFVMGESTTNGFPYGYNGTFSRVLQDALRDVMPRDTVEVVNLGVAAINSYALYDQVDEILARHPDAVMIYAGHNEFYGALGVGSTERAGASPVLVRTYLRLQRLKTFLLARELAVGIVRRLGGGASTPDSAADLMEYLVRDRSIPFGSPMYRRGVAQFADNLAAILRRFRDAGVPVFVGSLASNLRDQAPFRSVRTGPYPAADSAYHEARRALERGDLGEARKLFSYARDLDALRFRAPSEFHAVIRAAASRYGAHYVPVEEAFAAASHDGIPGSELFWEHLHPRQSGYLLMARAYFDALQQTGFLGRSVDTTRLRTWQAYYDRMELTEFDRQFAWHTVQSLMGRWPFVERANLAGYPANYRPTDIADSVAYVAVVGDLGWPIAKTRLADLYRSRGQLEPALAEYRGLIREQPVNVSFMSAAADLDVRIGEPDSARELLERAYGVEPSGLLSYLLASLELQAGRYAQAVSRLEQALQFTPSNPPVLFDLSRAYHLAGDDKRARYYANRLAVVNPGYPGLAQWQAKLAAVPD